MQTTQLFVTFVSKKVIRFLRDAAEEPTTEDVRVKADKLILENEKKCLEKIKKEPPRDKGLYCSRNWDGWLCWDDTPSGNYASQNCPDYFDDFDPTGELWSY